MMTESFKFYEDFFSETKVLLAEVEQLLSGVDLKCVGESNSNVSNNVDGTMEADSVVRSYMRMTEITHILESVLNNIHKNEAVFNGHVDSLTDAINDFKVKMDYEHFMRKL